MGDGELFFDGVTILLRLVRRIYYGILVEMSGKCFFFIFSTNCFDVIVELEMYGIL